MKTKLVALLMVLTLPAIAQAAASTPRPAAPRPFCVIPPTDPGRPPLNCPTNLRSEGAPCVCALPNGEHIEGSVHIVAPRHGRKV